MVRTPATIAIHNTRLFEEVQARTRELARPVEELEIASQHKSQLVANISHELRTPLAAMLGYAALLQEGIYGAPPEKFLPILTRIRSNGKRLLGLINTIRGSSSGKMARSIAPRPSTVPLASSSRPHSGARSLGAANRRTITVSTMLANAFGKVQLELAGLDLGDVKDGSLRAEPEPSREARRVAGNQMPASSSGPLQFGTVTFELTSACPDCCSVF
jgi:signal transduction histidine kinase